MRRLILITLVVLTALACTQDEGARPEERERPSQVVDNFKMEESVSGEKRYYLEGKRAFYYDRSNRIVVLSPNIDFFDSRNQVNSVVTCDSGVVENRTGDLRAYGGVKVVTRDSTVLRTDSLVWFNRRAEIETDAPVTITSGQGTVKGKGLIADAQLARIKIKEE